MKLRKVSVAALFLTIPFSLVYGQQDSVKAEKKIEGVNIRGVVKKGAESNLINLQRRSVEVIERVGSAQLEKQGIGDVATAVTKATGTQKQESSGQVFIRGLGDRNNSTTLNGLPLPSNDPTYKNVDLGIFSTDMIEYVGLEKVYHPKLWGDMNGANIDINSKIHTGKPYFKLSLGSSINFNSAKKANNFIINDGVGYLGFKSEARPSQQNLATAGYNVFQTSLENQPLKHTPINSSLGIEFGKNFSVGQVGRLSIFGYGNFSNNYNYLEGIFSSSYNAQGAPSKEMNGEEYIYSTNTTGLLNINYKINANHTLNLASNYIHTSENKLGEYRGFDVNVYDVGLNQGYTRNRLVINEINDLLVNQLKGEHKISQPLTLSWNVGYGRLDSKKPDRQQNMSGFGYSTNRALFPSSAARINHRYWDNLIEDDFSGNLQAEYKFNDKAKVLFGYHGRYKKSDFAAYFFTLNTQNAQAGSYYLNQDNYDSFFNQSNYLYGLFRVETPAPQTYNSTVFNNAGFVNLDYAFNEKLTAQVGVRYDNLDQKLDFSTLVRVGSIDKKYSKILPAVNLKYMLNDLHNIRFSASKTYTTPLLIEVAPFLYEEVDELQFGNMYLYPADNYNADLKWEWFPKKGELVSITAFGKYIQNPISRVSMSSSSTTISYFNVGDTGTVYGAELEVRKDLFNINSSSKIYTFFNATYLNTNQDLDNSKILSDTNNSYAVAFNNSKDKMTGASSFLANANLGWEQKWNSNTANVVVSYSHISDNVYALGSFSRGNLVDKAVNMLDATVRFELKSGIGISFTGKNLLNPTFERVQESTNQDITIRKYKRGIATGIGLSYKF
ncbi:MAG: TonB-dependent receptor [Myroides sp.]|nr:TonB-dependent receptor [Myroides sp.]